jgi:hypothetical protein
LPVLKHIGVILHMQVTDKKPGNDIRPITSSERKEVEEKRKRGVRRRRGDK